MFPEDLIFPIKLKTRFPIWAGKYFSASKPKCASFELPKKIKQKRPGVFSIILTTIRNLSIGHVFVYQLAPGATAMIWFLGHFEMTSFTLTGTQGTLTGKGTLSGTGTLFDAPVFR